jgi:tetratricopeptide (TPR) repeat protein
MLTRISCVAAIALMTSSGVQAAATNSTQATTAQYCGELKNSFGPFDYRKAQTEYTEQITLVHSAHFTSDIENLIKGRSGTLGGELDYTLRAFPNHHRALVAIDRLAIREKAIIVPGAKYPVECYFERAMRFVPDDGIVRAAYGNFLFARGKSDEALKMFIAAAELQPEDATINYNLGLAYLKAKNYEQANLHARKAYKLGFPLPGLKNKLIEAGQWDDKQLDPQDDKQQ